MRFTRLSASASVSPKRGLAGPALPASPPGGGAIGAPQPPTPASSSASSAAAPPLLRPLLLVSDLDDTLIGGERVTGARHDHPGGGGNGGAGTAASWLSSRAETLPLFLEAVAARGGVIPEPDALVCGVGTRIYLRAREGGPMGSAAGWAEHAAWAEHVSQEWSLEAVTEALEEAMRELGPGSLQWRDPDENEGLKLTVAVALGALPAGVAALDQRLRSARVRYRTVIGPTDDPPGWAYMDVLPARAGKNAAAHAVAALLLPPPPGVEGQKEGEEREEGPDARGAAHHSIAVSNCHPAVRSFALAALERQRARREAEEEEEEEADSEMRGAGLDDGREQEEGEEGKRGAVDRAVQEQAEAGSGAAARVGEGELQRARPLLEARPGAGVACGCGGAAVAPELGPVMGAVLRVLRGEGPGGEGPGGDRGGGGSGDGAATGLHAELWLAEPWSPRLRVHLASLPAAGGVMEGLRAFGFF
ncbi:hypothetical protein GPECTOR_912g170 [Gonium pectorale]|uniref:Sucrose phosphatase-like domain-containing protein n=1 Tax=Gonium pectorale TaxID=33097 RepID=A0A150FTU2_GONPE|nr:hypothetical protein GPECTOR_912g170 [Gonium pectorale]|eukprot:KXZ41041.1 hypothetical protein GPECTOR_912g170 [Gonium pectorale]